MDTLLVGLGCKARNGKDTLAQHIHELMPSETRIMGFADDLKAIARAFGMAEKNPPFLQALGVSMRELNSGYWIEALHARIVESGAKVVLIPDVRFENEARWIAMQGGLLYRVDRTIRTDDGGAAMYVANDRPARHPSETDCDGKDLFDEYIQIADGDMMAFREHAVRISYKIMDKLNARALVNNAKLLPDPNMPRTVTGLTATGAISALGVDLPDDDDPGVAM